MLYNNYVIKVWILLKRKPLNIKRIVSRNIRQIRQICQILPISWSFVKTQMAGLISSFVLRKHRLKRDPSKQPWSCCTPSNDWLHFLETAQKPPNYDIGDWSQQWRFLFDVWIREDDRSSYISFAADRHKKGQDGRQLTLTLILVCVAFLVLCSPVFTLLVVFSFVNPLTAARRFSDFNLMKTIFEQVCIRKYFHK